MIDKDKLRELLADESATTETIYRGLGFNNEAALYYHLKKDPEAKRMLGEWRRTHRRSRQPKNAPRVSKRAAKGVTPPRNGNAKGRISDELLRRLKHEIEHIALYDEKTEHFDQVAEEIRAIK